jgi:hypothetical protein
MPDRHLGLFHTVGRGPGPADRHSTLDRLIQEVVTPGCETSAFRIIVDSEDPFARCGR